jgi:hypothetical protein
MRDRRLPPPEPETVEPTVTNRPQGEVVMRRISRILTKRPPRFLAMESWTAIVPDTLPWASRTIDQSRLAISQARRPALTESRTMA